MQMSEAVSASANRSMRPPRIPPGLGPANLEKPSFWELHPLIFLTFCCILLHGADSASVLPFSMPYEADSAAILCFMLLYEADSDAMLQYFLLYGADHAAILLFLSLQFLMRILD